jgi:Holliday junction resolvase
VGRLVKRDANHREIALALKAAGCFVFDAARVGGGFPDLVVGRNRQTFLLEIKAPHGNRTPTQIEFHARWRGGPLHVVRSVEEALRVVGAKAAPVERDLGPSQTYREDAAQAERIQTALRRIRGGATE